jgi:hypothetical protein
LEKNKRRITGRVSEAENKELIEYAARLGLQKAQLVNILVLRALYGTQDASAEFAAQAQEADVTIMLPFKRDYERFRAWVEDIGTGAGPLVARLVRKELSEKWLANSVLGDAP